MAITGLSIPVFGKYAASQGSISYSEGKTMGHAISYSIDPTFSDNNYLWGDNKKIESDDGIFTSGTLTLNTSEFTYSLSKWILNITETTYTYTPTGASTAVSVKEQHFNDSVVPIYCGFGIIEQHIIDGTTYYIPIILPKVKIVIPSDAATTRGETIDWQTKELTFEIERDDSSTQDWKVLAEPQSTENDAFAYLCAKLGVSSS